MIRIRCILATAVALWCVPSHANVILQYFEGKWETIERRMPDIFVAGYHALWIPPTGRADTGGFSVGYDVYDRFDLGNAFGRTLYGTEETLRRMIDEAHRAGLAVYPDIVLNHNGFRDLGTPGFAESGDYPGFVVTLPNDIDGDFHGRFQGGVFNERLAGLIDIAQEKNHVFIRHPVNPGDPQNIPNEPARESNRRFYPDTDFNSPAALGNTSGDRHSPSGFNLDRPEAGDPRPENATGLLLRHVQWMNEVIGADGFRIDAEKHIPQFFFNDFYDGALDGTQPGGGTPFSFGEVFDGDFGLLASYVRKDGFGNRDVLDFPLYFRMADILNANGFGDMRGLEFASFDGSDGNANDGSRGVQFVSSHDNGPPGADNLGYAHILTRTGYPLVYFNAKEFGDNRDFPRGGRGDALGGQFGDRILRLLDLHVEHARGPHRTRWVDGDVYVYERENALLVGLNDNGAFAANRSFDTAFRNVTLVELTGNAGASATVTIGGDGRATVTIPKNEAGRGYAAWGLAAPRGVDASAFSVTPVSQTLAPDSDTVPNGVRRLTPIDVVTGNTATVSLRIEPQGLDDNAVLEVDGGGFDGFDSGSPSFGGGSGVFSSTLDLTGFAEANHYLEARAFLHRVPDTLPAIFQSFRKVIYVDRAPPVMALHFPTQTGDADVESTEYEVVLRNTDATANSVHVLPDFAGTDEQAIAAVNDGNRSNHVDRTEFRYRWQNITPGLHELVVVAFEETGNVGVTRFENIDVSVPVPAVRFQNLPEQISVSSFDDIQVQVNFARPGGGTNYTFDPTGTQPDSFHVQLTVDGVTYPAQPFSPALVGSINTLFQNDTDFSDTFDTYRFNWRGYGRGFHQFEASAELNDHSAPASVVTRTVEVTSDTQGPDFLIISPPPPDPGGPPRVVLNNPESISVTVGDLAASARSVTSFIQSGGSERLLATQAVDGTQTMATLTGPVSSSELYNGTATLRVQASTAPLGGGVVTEKSTAVLLLGVQDPLPSEDERIVDGDPNDWKGTPGSDIHSVVVSNGEWIYRGGEGDSRTDLGDDTDIGNQDDEGDFNMDLTELRIVADHEDVYFLARYRDVTDVHRPSFALAIDNHQSGDVEGLSFIGDQSATLTDSLLNTFNFNVQVHFTTENSSRVEMFDLVGDPTWFSPPGEESFVSATNDLIEFSVPRAALGLAGDVSRVITIQGATFENAFAGGVAWNNDVDSSRDIGAGPDALDVVGGEVGVAANAFGRAFADDNVVDSDDPNVTLKHDVEIPRPGESDLRPSVLDILPADGTGLSTADPVQVTITTDDRANSVLLAVNGALVEGALSMTQPDVKQWTATTPVLALGVNSLQAIAFTDSNHQGGIGTLGAVYTVTVPFANLEQLLNHLLGVEELMGVNGDINGDGSIDAADVVELVNP